MAADPGFLTRRRPGPRPGTTPTNPHTQLTQNAPAELQERVFDFAVSLAGVEVGPSLVSVPGARAFHLPSSERGAREAFLVGHEFAHLHPASDGSLHMALPPDVVDRAIENGWAERHPLAGRHGLPANIVMVYGPRDDNELAVVEDLVRASHALAAGRQGLTPSGDSPSTGISAWPPLPHRFLPSLFNATHGVVHGIYVA